MILSELYKVFIKQRLILFLIVLLMISCVYHIFIGYDTTNTISNCETYYNSFFEKYQGKITDNKTEKIKDEYKIIEKDNENLLANKREKQAFESFYHIYLYEVESGSGYLTDTRGWETLLCHDRINYFMVIFVILLGVILFSTEYENEMDIMAVSTPGRNRLTGCKILIGIFGSVFAGVLFQTVNYIYLMKTIGLENESYPLKTIEFFERASYKITLGQALMFKTVLNIFGCMLLVSLVMFFVVLFKKREISMVLSILAVILPTMIFSNGSTIYKIPWVSSLLSASGFFWPNIYGQSLVEDKLQKVISFQAIDKNWMLLVLCADVLSMVFFITIVFFKFSNYYIPRRKNKKINKAIISGLLMCFCLTGCTKSGQSQDVSIDGSLGAQTSISDGKYVYYIDSQENRIYCEDDMKNRVAVTRNVFPIKDNITNIFIDNNKCYYLLENDTSTDFYVYSIDLDTFEQKLVYSTGSKNTEDFYGLAHDESSDVNKILENIVNVNWFIVTDKYIYYQKDSSIYRCSLVSGRQYIVDESVSDGEVRYKDGTLYYTDAHGKEVSYSESS